MNVEIKWKRDTRWDVYQSATPTETTIIEGKSVESALLDFCNNYNPCPIIVISSKELAVEPQEG